jgi:Protein of unknown function (DUF3775)
VTFIKAHLAHGVLKVTVPKPPPAQAKKVEVKTVPVGAGTGSGNEARMRSQLNSAGDWATVRAGAARAHNNRTASYLLGTPLLGDFLEEGLSMLGYSCAEFEMGHL